jgi:phage terminase large subunit-like protein
MADDFYFDERAALAVERFFDRLLVHIEGPLAGQPFTLAGWQREMVREVFGWKRCADGLRRYRRVYLEIPRGNGKSTFAAGLALYLLIADGERSAKVYSAAADKAQAAIVFETADKMAQASPFLAKRLRSFRNRTMEYAETGSKYIVLSSDAYTKHGLSPSGVVIDELHAQPNRELYDVLNTAMGKRSQPLMIMITTAGYDRESICFEQHEYARQVAAGVVDDPTFYPAIFAADPDDDWTQPETWAKANPNYGVSVREEFLRQECITALASPAYVNTFKRLYLNIWTSQETQAIDPRAWQEGGGPVGDLAGRPCYVGIDLSSTVDLSAVAAVFPPGEGEEHYTVLAQCFIPGADLVERERRDRAPYGVWAQQGHITLTPGNVIDYQVIIDQLEQWAQVYDVRELGIDPWNSVQIALDLEGLGYPVVQVRQGYQTISAPTKELLRLVQARQLRHGDNPVLRWMADNVEVTMDPAGNMKFVKGNGRARKRIDGLVATVIGLSRAMVNRGQGRSVYEQRDVREL